MRIAIDLTPLLPGGANGGAKIMTLKLIKELATLAPQNEFSLLATKKNFSELSLLASDNIKVISAAPKPILTIHTIFLAIVVSAIWVTLKYGRILFSKRVIAHLRKISQRLYRRLLANSLINNNKFDLLFCPFTAPYYRNLNIPIVSVIYDLQSHYYPFFFNPNECYERKKNFNEACKWSAKLVCISDFVKQTVIENSSLRADQLKTIPIRLAYRLPAISADELSTTLDQLNLTSNCYLLYPANFWTHKNHLLLFTAFNIFHKKHPNSRLKLICTGADNENKTNLLHAVKAMGLESFIILPGYLSDQEFSSLIQGCLAVIFPSLYEGFGMPILEAMAAGKPVLCSNVTSLPEVASYAALLFDPRKPNEIAEAIARIESEPELAQQLISLGYQRLAECGTEADMAKEYLEIFKDTVACV